MPTNRPRAAEVAIETRRTYIPYITRNYPQWPPGSFLYRNSGEIAVSSPSLVNTKSSYPSIAIEEADPVDLALFWWEFRMDEGLADRPHQNGIAVVNPAHELRAGGDWESGLIAAEECFSRRSNLPLSLNNRLDPRSATMHYPLPAHGGLYTPHVGQYS
jgi:hypothetical protein